MAEIEISRDCARARVLVDVAPTEPADVVEALRRAADAIADERWEGWIGVDGAPAKFQVLFIEPGAPLA